MKHKSLIGLLLWLAVVPAAAQMMVAKSGLAQAMVWRIDQNTQIVINGQSNISKISCGNQQYKGCDSLVIVKGMSHEQVPVQGALAMELIDFNCHNYFFTSHLRKILKVDEYPHMVIRIVRLDKLPDGQRDCDACGVVEISLAGVTRTFNIPIRFSQAAGGKAVLMGNRKFCLKDFDLKPPPKVPFVKVKNEFVVEFSLALSRVR